MPTGNSRLEIAMRGRRSLPAVLTVGLPAVLTARLPAAVAARRLLRSEATLVVTRLLGDQRAAVRAGLAVELAGAGRVVGVCHIAYT